MLGRVTALIENGPRAHAAEAALSLPPTTAMPSLVPVTVAAAGTARITAPVPVPPPLPPLAPSQSDLQERLLSLRAGIDLFWRSPVFGAGLGAFQNENIPSSITGVPLLIHSVPLWLLAELGLVGFAIFAVPGAYAFVTEWRRAQREQAAAFGVLLMLAFAVMCAPADMLYQRTFWLLIGAALAVPLGNANEQRARRGYSTLIHFGRVFSTPLSTPYAESDRSMYSIYDVKLGRLMSTGRNSPTKQAAKEDLLHYLSGSFTREELAPLVRLSPDELAARHHYKIFKHLTPYPADKQYSSL
jgi:hypothetical protein